MVFLKDSYNLLFVLYGSDQFQQLILIPKQLIILSKNHILAYS